MTDAAPPFESSAILKTEGVCYPCCKRSCNWLDDCNPLQDLQTLASPLATARNIPYLQTPRNLREVFAMWDKWLGNHVLIGANVITYYARSCCVLHIHYYYYTT